LVTSFWWSKSDFGLDFLDFEMTLGPWRWKMSICYGKAGFEFEFQPLDFVFQPLPWPEALPSVEPFKRWKTVDERRS
jgi:hypothetical protein